MDDAQYIACGGSRCPQCHSNDIEGDDTNFDSGSVSQRVSCNNCRAQWYDVYALQCYELSTPGDPEFVSGPGHDEPDQ